MLIQISQLWVSTIDTEADLIKMCGDRTANVVVSVLDDYYNSD